MNVIFVGGPDGKKFINNYIQGLAAHGINVVRHWLDPMRKTYLPADVQAVIVNGDASSPVHRSHIKDMCEREGVPMIVGNNSVSKTVTLMTERGLIKEEQQQHKQPEPKAPKSLFVDEHGQVFDGAGIPVLVEAGSGKVYIPDDQFSNLFDDDVMATVDDVKRRWPEAEMVMKKRESAVETVPERKEDKVMKLEEAKELVIDRDGGLRLRMAILSDSLDHPVTRSLTPVVWGDEFYASKTALAEKHGVGPANLGTYVASGNPFKGRILRMAGAEDVLRAYPGIKVTDERDKLARTIEIDGGRAFMRIDGGRRQKIVMCPDKNIRTRQEASEYAGLSERSLDGKVESGIDGFGEPSLDEIRAQWPAAEIKIIDNVPEKKPVVTAPSGDVRLMDIITPPPGTNFVALLLNDNAFLVPVSDAARALVPETRLFRDLESIRQLFPVGLLTVRL